MAVQASQVRKVVWAVDVLNDGKKARGQMLRLLQEIVPPNAMIEPVYVMSPDLVRMAAEVFPETARNFESVIREKLAAWRLEQSWRALTEPTLLISKQVMLRSSVSTLIAHAQRSQADLIAVTTSARTGVERFFLGSFAELLIVHSPVPVLLLNPKSKVPAKIARVLFAFDFSREAEAALVEMAKFARILDAELVLFHQLESTSIYPTEVKAIWPDLGSSDKENLVQRHAAGNRWIDELRAYGVKARFILGTKPMPVADSILSHAAKLKVSLLALASRRGSLAATVAGSVCRQVCRTSTFPVWVLHPDSTGAASLKNG